MAKANQAPFLTAVSVSDPPADDADGPLSEASEVDESPWDPSDFPAWYRDKVTGEGDDADDTEAADLPKPDADDAVGDVGDGGVYPFDLATVRTVDRLRFGAVTVLAGDNGSGKSTLIEAIATAAGFNPEGGSRNLRFATYDTHSTLADRLTLAWRSRPRWGWFLRAETFYNMATHIARDDDPYGGVAHIFPDLHNRSHGESFLDLATSRFDGKGFYLLDEPESALSIQGLMGLLAIVNASLARGSQFIISTHSPLLMSVPDAAVYQLDAETGIEACDFEDLTSTALWRRFLDDPVAFHRLLEDGSP